MHNPRVPRVPGTDYISVRCRGRRRRPANENHGLIQNVPIFENAHDSLSLSLS